MKHCRPIDTKGKDPVITSPYSASHPGIDYGYVAGTNVYATQDGKVTVAIGNETRQWIANKRTNPRKDPYLLPSGNRALNNADYGNRIQISHSATESSLYAHLQYDSLYVKVGDTVKKGQLIGRVGSTGNSTGNHLHYELMINGKKVNLADHFDNTFSKYFEAGETESNMYRGYNLLDMDSMKAAVDVVIRVQSGELVDRPVHEKALKDLEERLRKELSGGDIAPEEVKLYNKDGNIIGNYIKLN